MKPFVLMIAIIFIVSCDPVVTEFPENSDAIMYAAETPDEIAPKDTLTVMTWNIRFGAARMAWFGDACGDRVILTDAELMTNLDALATYLNTIDPDILFLQEIDVESKRTGYVDQVQWVLDHTALNYGAYASMWQVQFIPSDGLGRMDTGNAVLSKWPIVDAVRHQLALRGDQDALTTLFYLRRNVLETRIEMDAATTFYAVDVHATAFATDDTKQKHIREYTEILDRINAAGHPFISGGDLNSVPGPAVRHDYCMADICADESYHQSGDDPYHKDGSWFGAADSLILDGLYAAYQPELPLSDYVQNEPAYFTHTTDFNALTGFDRKLDYLWTNRNWVPGSAVTHWDAAALSDHLPVSSRWEVAP